MNGAAITSRVQIASLDLFDGDNEPMHPSLIEKPALSVADLHVICKLLHADCTFTVVEGNRLWELGEVLDNYLSKVVGEDWDEMEALVVLDEPRETADE